MFNMQTHTHTDLLHSQIGHFNLITAEQQDDQSLFKRDSKTRRGQARGCDLSCTPAAVCTAMFVRTHKKLTLTDGSYSNDVHEHTRKNMIHCITTHTLNEELGLLSLSDSLPSSSTITSEASVSQSRLMY